MQMLPFDPSQSQRNPSKPDFPCLDRGLVCDRYNSLRYVLLHRNGSRLPWHQWLSLQVYVGTISLRLLLELGIGLDSADELLSRSGKGNVLDSEVDALLDITVLDLLVDDNTDGALGDVVDDSGLSVVNLVGHTVDCQPLPLPNPYAIFPAIVSQICADVGSTNPFWTAPFALISTMSPTLHIC